MKKVRIKINRQVVAFRLPKKVKERIIKDLTLHNPKWIENQRMGRYNRGVPKFLRFYSLNSNSIEMPLGYMETLLQRLTSEKIKFDLFETKHSQPSNFKFNGQLRDFQETACQKLLQYNVGTLESPTGSGKTVIGLWMIAARQQRSIVIVHTKDLLYQWIERAMSFLKLPKSSIGIIGDGKDRLGSDLTIGLVQSLYSRVNDINRSFGHIIVDECHRAPSRTFSEVLSALHAPFQLGLSATAYRRDGLSKLISLYVGPKRHSIPKQQLVNDGHIMQAKFIIRPTQFKPFSNPVAYNYTTIISEIIMDKRRNEMICIDVAKMVFEGNVCLVLSDRKSHCNVLKEMIFKRHNIYAEVLTGSTKQSERKEIISRVNNGKCNLIIATGQLIGEGFDCKNLSTMFIVTPISYAGRVTQYVGRVLRPCKGKDQAIVYDYADIEVNQLLKSLKSRMRVYGKKNVTWT